MLKPRFNLADEHAKQHENKTDDFVACLPTREEQHTLPVIYRAYNRTQFEQTCLDRLRNTVRGHCAGACSTKRTFTNTQCWNRACSRPLCFKLVGENSKFGLPRAVGKLVHVGTRTLTHSSHPYLRRSSAWHLRTCVNVLTSRLA